MRPNPTVIPTLTFIGLPGSGKSTIGRQLARRLDLEFVDSDQVLEQRLGCSIKDYFTHQGEEAFRDQEERVIDELSQQTGIVLSTGGGAVLRSKNRDNLYNRTQVIYLRARPDNLARRLRADKTRPLLQVADPLTKMRELYAIRDPLYRETAHFVVEAGRSSAAMLLNTVVMQLELAGIGL